MLMNEEIQRINLDDYIQTGAEYELIKNKRSYTRIISQEPERLEEISFKFASMAKELHTKQADPTLPAWRSAYRQHHYRRPTRPLDRFRRICLWCTRVGLSAPLDHVPQYAWRSC